jgi:hypothetical protein
VAEFRAIRTADRARDDECLLCHGDTWAFLRQGDRPVGLPSPVSRSILKCNPDAAACHSEHRLVLNLLARAQGRIAIYGWHRPNGAPIQPLSTVHGVCFADYSHGIRLVSEMAIEDGTFRAVRDILQDSRLANVLSDEGTIRAVLAGGAPHAGEGHCGQGI